MLRATAHLEFEHQRWESVVATARRLAWIPSRPSLSGIMSFQLFKELKSLHQLPAEYEQLAQRPRRCFATRASSSIHQGHHRHTQYIISSSEIYGYTQLQRTMVSAICALFRQEPTAAGDRALRNIPIEEHKHVHRAVVLLRWLWR